MSSREKRQERRLGFRGSGSVRLGSVRIKKMKRNGRDKDGEEGE